MNQKKSIFSGIQPTGIMTLGNYIGAVKNWVEMQEEYDCTYCVVDLHAITVRQDPQVFRKNILQGYALLMACGIDPDKSTLFLQSHNPHHAELAWVLNCHTQFGELSRMTQFKDKSAKHADNINAGLFTYPALMAADILLYQANLVPVGIDQKQHVELTRDIAQRFNALYGDTFVIPGDYIPKADQGAKIMSLQEPGKKMSKSDENPNAFISILDEKDVIIKKCKRAVTDSDARVVYGEGKDGINNLLTIYSVVTGKTVAQVEAEFAGKGYGDFKTAVGEVVADHLRPVREQFAALINDPAHLEQCYRKGAQKAMEKTAPTMALVYERLGFAKI